MQGGDAALKQVLADFEHESHLNLHNHPIHMSFSGGALTVAGEVPDIAPKKRIVRLAHSLNGAGELVHRLRVKVETPVGGGALPDSVCERLLHAVDVRHCVICAFAKGQLEMLRGTMDAAGNGDGSGAIEVTVQDGVVTLTGQVISLSHRRLAGVLAWWAGSCCEVVNLLDVSPAEENSDDESTEALHLVLEADPCVRADQIVVKSQNHRVILEGWVSSEAERRQAEQDAWYLDQIDRVVNRIDVRA
jgi:osmotically-inducible protein OsmY